MKIKPLPTQEYLIECFDYNPITGDVLWKERPVSHFKTIKAANTCNTTFAGKNAGSIENDHLRIYVNGKFYLAHRIIFKIMTGKEPISEIDHIDRDGLNNRWENLREASQSQNRSNRGGFNSKSGLKGAQFHKKSGKYQSVIKSEGKTKYLGLFNTAEEAHKMYCHVAKSVHGEFSCLM